MDFCIFIPSVIDISPHSSNLMTTLHANVCRNCRGRRPILSDLVPICVGASDISGRSGPLSCNSIIRPCVLLHNCRFSPPYLFVTCMHPHPSSPVLYTSRLRTVAGVIIADSKRATDINVCSSSLRGFQFNLSAFVASLLRRSEPEPPQKYAVCAPTNPRI